MTKSRAYYMEESARAQMPACYSEGMIQVFSSRLAAEHLYQVPFRGLAEYRIVLARTQAVIEQRAAEESAYAWEWTSAQIRVTRHGRYTPPRYTTRSWKGAQRIAPAIIV